MPATASYTITYQVIGVVGDPPVDVNIYIKPNAAAVYTLAFTEIAAVPGNTYTYTFNNLDSHTVHQVKLEGLCSGGSVQFGDITYLSNPQCQEIDTVPNAGTLDVSWDCFTPVNGDSVIEYRIEYRESSGVGPYFIETIPISTVLTYWSTNPGTYPNFLYNLTTGILVGDSYEVNLYTTLEFDYVVAPPVGTILSQILVGPCTVFSPVV